MQGGGMQGEDEMLLVAISMPTLSGKKEGSKKAQMQSAQMTAIGKASRFRR